MSDQPHTNTLTIGNLLHGNEHRCQYNAVIHEVLVLIKGGAVSFGQLGTALPNLASDFRS